MKKKIETGITIFLIGLSFLIISVLIAGIIDLRLKDTSNLSIYSIIGLVLACICSYVFPKINTLVIQKPSIIPGETKLINEYIRDPGSMFLYIAIGYSGILLCIYAPYTLLHVKWFVGFFLIFCYFQGLLTPYLGIKQD